MRIEYNREAVPEDEPLPDEVEAIRRANENIKEYGTISHDAIDWN